MLYRSNITRSTDSMLQYDQSCDGSEEHTLDGTPVHHGRYVYAHINIDGECVYRQCAYWMFLTNRKKPDNPEETHRDTRKTEAGVTKPPSVLEIFEYILEYNNIPYIL